MSDAARPCPKLFPGDLQSYAAQIREATDAGKHHDARRHLLLRFFHQAFGIAPEEVALGHQITAGATCATWPAALPT
jgi:hypothetical protein